MSSMIGGKCRTSRALAEIQRLKNTINSKQSSPRAKRIAMGELYTMARKLGQNKRHKMNLNGTVAQG